MIKEIMNVLLSSQSNKKGIRLLEKGKYEEAIKYFDKSLEQDSSNLNSLNNKGSALRLLNRYDEALKCFDMVLLAEGGAIDDWEGSDISISALVNKGSTFANMGKYEEALKIHKLALKLDPNRATITFNIAVDLVKLKRGSEAVDIFINIIKKEYGGEFRNFEKICSAFGISIENKFSPLLKSVFLEKLEEYDTANEELKKFEESIRNSKIKSRRDIEEFKAIFFADVGLYKEEIRCHEKILKEYPEDITASVNKAVALTELEEYEKAIVCYDKLLKLNHNSVVLLLNKGSTLGRMGRYKEAIQCFDKVLKIEPKNKVATEHKSLSLRLLKKKGG